MSLCDVCVHVFVCLPVSLLLLVPVCHSAENGFKPGRLHLTGADAEGLDLEILFIFWQHKMHNKADLLVFTPPPPRVTLMIFMPGF